MNSALYAYKLGLNKLLATIDIKHHKSLQNQGTKFPRKKDDNRTSH